MDAMHGVYLQTVPKHGHFIQICLFHQLFFWHLLSQSVSTCRNMDFVTAVLKKTVNLSHNLLYLGSIFGLSAEKSQALDGLLWCFACHSPFLSAVCYFILTVYMVRRRHANGSEWPYC